MIFEIPKDTEVLQIDITELKKQIRADAIDEIHSMCGAEKPCYANCNSCMFAYFENDFETTICKLEQLKEQEKW